MMHRRLQRLFPDSLFRNYQPPLHLIGRPVVDINIFRPTSYIPGDVLDNGWKIYGGTPFRSDWGKLSDELARVNAGIRAGTLDYRTAIIAVGDGGSEALRCLEKFRLPPHSLVWSCSMNDGAAIAERVAKLVRS